MKILAHTAFLCLVVSVLSQSSRSTIAERVNTLFCDDSGCTQVDNSSIAYFAGYWNCLLLHNMEYAYRQCNNGTISVALDSLPACAVKEERVFCSEIFRNIDMVPSACNTSITSCTSECSTALVDRFGCCLSYQLNLALPPNQANMELIRLWELCKFNPSNSCQLAVPSLPDSIPFLGSDQCSGTLSLSQNTFKGMCGDHLNYTQDLVSKAVQNTCTGAKRYGVGAYLYCDSDGDGLCGFKEGALSNSSNIRRHCTTLSGNCTSECRDSLIEAKEAFGCCINSVNYLNEFIPSGAKHYPCGSNEDIWSHCGVPSPGFCSGNPLALTLTSTPSTLPTPSTPPTPTTPTTPIMNGRNSQVVAAKVSLITTVLLTFLAHTKL